MDEFDALIGPPLVPLRPRFVIFSSYGNDSVALIQWAKEQSLTDVTVVYSDTGWAAKWWAGRVADLESWVRSIGFSTSRTTSIGFAELARKKQAFPTQMYQWCSYVLKIEPGERWLQTNDPDRHAVCLVGVRRDEGQDRASFPLYDLKSESHGGRIMVAPLAEWAAESRNALLARAGVEPLPHRSMECSPCINANRDDLRATAEEDIRKVEALEKALDQEFGLTANGKPRTFFRPARHMGATGVREVVRWAKSARGKFKLSETEELGSAGCVAGWCGT